MPPIRGEVLLTTGDEREWFQQDIADQEGNEFTADIVARDHAEAEKFVAKVTRAVEFRPVRDMRKAGSGAQYRGYAD